MVNIEVLHIIINLTTFTNSIMHKHYVPLIVQLKTKYKYKLNMALKYSYFSLELYNTVVKMNLSKKQ